MVLATVPTVTLALFGVGAVERGAAGARRVLGWARERLSASGPGTLRSRWREVMLGEPRDRLETDLLLALAFAAAVFLFFREKNPIFGGTKHWLPAYPSLALFAGRGFDLVAVAMGRALPRLERRRWLAAQGALFASVVAAPLAITIHSHPFGLSAYVPLVGGTAGGADLGLNRQFWGYTTQSAAEEYLNRQAPRGATVFIHDTTWDAWSHMQQEGRVRSDLRAVGAPHEAQIALVQHELHMSEVDYSIWTARDRHAHVHRGARRRANRQHLPAAVTLDPRERVRRGGLRGAELLAWLGEHGPPARDAAIEELLGIARPPATPALGEHRMPYMPSAVAPIVRAVLDVPITAGDVFVDLGAGLGKAAMAVHLLTGARARGIELQPELVAAARAQARELGLDGVSFVETDALDADLDDATVVFLYLPFTGDVLAGVLRRIEAVARRRQNRPLLAGARPARRRLVRRATDRGVLAVNLRHSHRRRRAATRERALSPRGPRRGDRERAVAR